MTGEQERLPAHDGLREVDRPGPQGGVQRPRFSRGRRLVFHGMLAVGLARGLVDGLRSSSGKRRS